MNVKYTGPALDYSGYGEANRHDIAALLSNQIDVTVELTRHCLESSNYGKLTELIAKAADKPLDYKIKILHTTPNIYGQFIEPNKYHVARVFWETDKLPSDFAKGVSFCNEVWTGSQYCANAIKKAGVNKPIYIIPEAIDAETVTHIPYEPENRPNGLYNFYSIFEWTERKNPKMLLEAYWREFEGIEDVGLTIKTYLDNFTKDKRSEIDSEIKALKHRLQLKTYAPVFLYRDIMERHQIYRFHKTNDCFVSAHRGEGWGIPQMEAMLVGNPVISTSCGGIHEHLNFGEAILIPYKLIPLLQNNRNQQWYTSDQQWAEPNIDYLRMAMRWLYTHKDEGKKMGKKGKQAVIERFSVDVVGQKMKQRLEEIQKTLD